ncbi:DUF4307 domain-containing protein [Antiquaquibacter soli]|uniref:DUF4307 domain-containing protein n=1 Tax=Antiquaquibacter soli TaxID=3064523 RepID=A0ABT9BPN2_9MICO|nr:DUF4307 domain-containing protein [Protaetiibacter sp. WY-16]MDO7881262.1 DUF4307 domain-containing protein [Protaetiibacter sp. WY-16]
MTSPLDPADRVTDALAARYGRTPRDARRTRVVVVIAAIAFAVVFVLWLWWGGLLGAPAQFEVKDTGHDIVDDSTVTVEWQFSVDPGTDARCAVQALNSTFAIVGWTVVDVPASDARTRDFSQELRTTERAVTGLIYRCWLT